MPDVCCHFVLNAGKRRPRERGTGVFRWMQPLSLYITSYCGGRGYGVTALMPGGGCFLFRAVRVRGHELGMTAFARLVACALCVKLDRRRDHIPTDVGDVTTDRRVRLVLP